MERTWTTKQVFSFLMLLGAGLQLTFQMVEQTTPMDSIDRLLNACVSQTAHLEPDSAHFQAFQDSLEPGFFNAHSQHHESLHEDVMDLSDASFLALVANLSQHSPIEPKAHRHLSKSPQQGL